MSSLSKTQTHLKKTHLQPNLSPMPWNTHPLKPFCLQGNHSNRNLMFSSVTRYISTMLHLHRTRCCSRRALVIHHCRRHRCSRGWGKDREGGIAKSTIGRRGRGPKQPRSRALLLLLHCCVLNADPPPNPEPAAAPPPNDADHMICYYY